MHQKYKQAQSLGQLPLHRCHDDDEWLNEKLSQLAHARRAEICARYSQEYRRVYAQTENEIRRENAARFAANTRLRIYLQKLSQCY